MKPQPSQKVDARAFEQIMREHNRTLFRNASAERKEMRLALESQIDALPDNYRAVFMLRAVEELSVEETAAVLEIPPATVRTRFFRARSLLREALAQKIDLAYEDAFSFAGARCDRIVARVLERIRPSKETA